MFTRFKLAIPAALLMLALLAGNAKHAAAVDIPSTATLLNDRWHYPFNPNPGTNDYAALFLTHNHSSLNLRDGLAVVQWQPVVPAILTGHTVTLTKATISIWVSKSANFTDPALGGTTLNGYSKAIQVFAAGFGPTNNETGWNGTQAFVGGSPGPSAHAARDPFPRNRTDNAHVEENALTAVPWANGVIQGVYTPGTMANAFRIDFELDLNNSTIRNKVEADIASGKSSWVFSAQYEATGPSDVTSIPLMIMAEAGTEDVNSNSILDPNEDDGNLSWPADNADHVLDLGDSNYGTDGQAPKLVLEFADTTPVTVSGFSVE